MGLNLEHARHRVNIEGFCGTSWRVWYNAGPD